MKVEQFTRIIIKRSSVPNEIATLAPLSINGTYDHTLLPAWKTTDIYIGEFFMNQSDENLWIRFNSTTIKKVLFESDVLIGLSGSSGTDGTSGTDGSDADCLWELITYGISPKTVDKNVGIGAACGPIPGRLQVTGGINLISGQFYMKGSSGAAGQVLISSGAGDIPYWGSMIWETTNYGISPITTSTKVGIGAASGPINGKLQVTGGINLRSSPFYMNGVAGSAGQYLMSNGNALPSWSTVTSTALKITTGAGAGKILYSDASGNASWGDPIWYVDGNDNVAQTSPHLSTTINGLKFDISGLSVNGFVNIDIFGNLRSANGTSKTLSFRDRDGQIKHVSFANGICTGHS